VSRPRVLLVFANLDWPATALFPEAADRAGFEVSLFGAKGHLASLSRFVHEPALYDAPIDVPAFQRGLAAHLEAWPPDLVIAADDPALWLLHRFFLGGAAPPRLAAILARSLARPDRMLALERKSALPPDLCPPRLIDPAVEAAEDFARAQGYPVVVKHDYSWGALAVRFCRDPDELRAALAETPPLPAPDARSVTVSRFLPGATIEVAYAAWSGRLLGALPLRKVTVAKGAAAAVVERADDALVPLVERLVAEHGLSGIGDVEFRSEGEKPYLLEINPRLVPLARAGRLLGLDLYRLLREAAEGQVGGVRVAEAPMGARVALFPTECLRDPASPHLDGVHDVPWRDRALLGEWCRRIALRPGGETRVDPMFSSPE
jgi:hypothetical protein